MLPGAEKGIEFLLTPDFSKVTPDVFLGAMGQAFFSLSLGMGCLSTYASYFGKETRLGHTAMSVGLIDTCVAVLAGLIIFPAAFSVGIEPDAGPSLILSPCLTCSNGHLVVFLSWDIFVPSCFTCCWHWQPLLLQYPCTKFLQRFYMRNSTLHVRKQQVSFLYAAG